MLTENEILMSNARDTLRNRWGDAIAAIVVYGAIMFILGLIPGIGTVATFLIGGPMTLGLYLFFKPFIKGETPRVAVLFDGFKSFLDSFVAYIVSIIFIFLWTLLLIVPGMIAAMSYSMIFLIMAENPGMDGLSAIKKSKEVMDGYKWKYACLMGRFIGWFLLCIITCGIAGLWVGPYWVASKVLFFEDIKKDRASTKNEPELISLDPSPTPEGFEPGS
jgi:uncharacterized membrane protein